MVVGLPNLFFQNWYSKPTLKVLGLVPVTAPRSYITCLSILVSAAVSPPNSFLPLEAKELAKPSNERPVSLPNGMHQAAGSIAWVS